MSEASPLLRREDVGGVATLILGAEGSGPPINTLSRELLAQLSEWLPALEADASVKAVVLLSGKRDNFIAGADLNMLRELRGVEEVAALSNQGKELLARIEVSPKPWVAAIHGSCLGGGLEVALACRYRVASDDPATQLGQPEVQLGLLPGAGGTQRLPRLIGIQAGLDLILTGRSVRGKKLLQLGLVDELVPPSILRSLAERRAAELADGKLRPEDARARSGMRGLGGLARLVLEGNPLGRAVVFRVAKKKLLARTHGHYPAPERALEVVRRGFEKGVAEGYRAESLAFAELCTGPVAKRLIGIFFAQSDLKKDSGAEEPGIEPRPLQKIGVLGGGLMGGGIAYVTANAGLTVRLKDKDDAGVAHGLAQAASVLAERVQRRSLTRQQASDVLARITGTVDYSGLRGVDLFIEAVFEDLALKRQVVADVEAFSRPEAVFASNTSSIPIAQIAEGSQRPENIVGMHYFSPVQKMPLLEVIRQPRSSPQAVVTAVALGKRQGKTVIVVNDGPGFYTTRILAPYAAEAGFLLEAGASVEAIDAAMVEYGFPVGPLQLLDEVGIDTAAKIAKVLQGAFGDRMVPPAGFARLVAEGRAGRKNRRGFYLYDGGKQKRVDATVYGGLGREPRGEVVPRAEIAERLSLQMINEAAFCLGEGILRSPRDGDVGAVFGLGFPPFRGGPFRAADAMGAAELVRRLEAWRQKFGSRFTPAPLLLEQARSGQKFYPD